MRTRIFLLLITTATLDRITSSFTVCRIARKNGGDLRYSRTQLQGKPHNFSLMQERKVSLFNRVSIHLERNEIIKNPFRKRKKSLSVRLTILTTGLILFWSRFSMSIVSAASLGITSKSDNVIQKVFHLCAVILTGLIIWDTYKVQKRQSRDATSEWGRYAKNPVRRSYACTLLTFRLLPYMLGSRILPSKYARKFRISSGKILAEGLLRLGPLYIKIGQILSCRENLLPKEWISALERLQDCVPSKSGNDAVELAYESFGDKETFHKVLSHFDDVPLAAASLGQVHKGVLRETNQTVAIKLQRQNLRLLYDKDLALMRKLASSGDKFVSKISKNRSNQNYTEIFMDAQNILYKEIDYRIEAQNTIRFADGFGIGFGGKTVTLDNDKLPSAASWLRVPLVYEKYSTEKLLIMEYVPSIKINNRVALQEAKVSDEDLEFLASSLARCYLRQFCSNLFFSTDPHPGNLGVEVFEDRPPRLVFYDFGQVCELKRSG